MEQAYTAYFARQVGGGGGSGAIGPVYRASYSHQRGRGCCGIGRVLGAVAAPYVAKGIRALGEEASSATFGLYHDIQRDASLSGVRTAAISRLSQAGNNLKRRAKHALSGRGSAKKRKKAPAPKRPAKTRSKKGIKGRSPRKQKQKGRGSRGVKKRRTTETFGGPTSDIFS